MPILSVIDDTTNNDRLFPKGFGTGFDPAQLVADKATAAFSFLRPLFGDAPDQLKVIPRSEWDARIDEQERLNSSLWHLRQTMADGQPAPTLDQNGQGYCWAYSMTRAVMYIRAVANMPYKRLSAHAVGCKVKNFRDEGGWCGLSAQFIRQNGVPSIEQWPEKSMARSNDKPEVWAWARQNIVTEDWCDAAQHPADQNLTIDQVATCLLLNIPLALDYNWWGHSVCGIQWCRIEAGSYGPKIDNSWTDQWEDKGTSILRGQKAVPMGSVAFRRTRIAPVPAGA